MKALFIIIPLLSILSCTTNTPEPQQGVVLPAAVPAPGPTPPAADQAAFDPGSITVEEFDSAKSEIQILIEEIHRVIQAKDYTKWLTYLSDDFIATINTPAYLAEISKTSRQLTIQKIVLKTPRDYFTHVVVAARKSINVDTHLDDIEFLSHNRVKAFAVVRNQRLRLFEFVRSRGGAWKVALPE
jgi:hypothetical protein